MPSLTLSSRHHRDKKETVGYTPSRRSSSSLTDKTIVLDMDLTLICTIGDGSDLSQRMRTNHKKAYDILKKRGSVVPTTLTQFGGSGKAVCNDVVKRPGLNEFLSFCRNTFKNVILWSAGQPSYVYDTVRLVIDTGGNTFDHIYTAQDVVSSAVAISSNSNSYTYVPTKPLELITKNFPDANLDNMVIIDDLRPNFIPNPRNGIWIPPFSPDIDDLISHAEEDDNICGDFYLYRLIHYLADEDFLKSTDVRDYDLDFF